MEQKRFIKVVILFMVLILTILFYGCGQRSSDNDIIEEPEITLEYLSGEYAEQILRDGGEDTLGTIEITAKGNDNSAGSADTLSLTIHNMVIVESSITDEGYYVADKNLSSTVPLSSDAYVTYIKSRKKGPEVVALKDFLRLVQKDAEKQKDHGLEPGNEKLYQVYIIGDTAVMILAKELPDV